MKLRNKPKKPAKKKIKLTYSVCYGSTFQDAVDYFRSVLEHDYTEAEIAQHLTLGNILIESEWDYDEYRPVAILEVPPSDYAYSKALNKYKKKLEAYNQWYNENKDAIEAEKIRRIDEDHKKKMERLQKEAADAAWKLQREIDRAATKH